MRCDAEGPSVGDAMTVEKSGSVICQRPSADLARPTSREGGGKVPGADLTDRHACHDIRAQINIPIIIIMFVVAGAHLAWRP